MKGFAQCVVAAACLGGMAMVPFGVTADPVADPGAAEPGGFRVDTQDRQVYLPDRGWVSAEVFWDIYYNHPQDLPAVIDFGAIETIRPVKDVDPSSLGFEEHQVP